MIPSNAEIILITEITEAFLRDPTTLAHHRLQTFAKKGLACAVEGCQRCGTHIAVWYDGRQYAKRGSTYGGLHVDIVGYEPDGTEYLMTVDHIQPRFWGGSDEISNKNPMCAEHNFKKGHRPDSLRLKPEFQEKVG